MPILPLKSRSKRGFYTDNDEALRHRARSIAQLNKAYEQGGYYNDMGERGRANAAKDYDLISRLRPSGQAMKTVISSYSEKLKRGKK